jgi:hypothetical protein
MLDKENHKPSSVVYKQMYVKYDDDDLPTLNFLITQATHIKENLKVYHCCYMADILLPGGAVSVCATRSVNISHHDK